MTTIGSENQRCMNAMFRCLDAMVILNERDKASKYLGSFLIDYKGFKKADTLDKLSWYAVQLEKYASFLENKC